MTSMPSSSRSRGGPVRLWDTTGVKPTVKSEPGGSAGVRLVLVTPDSELLVGVADGPGEGRFIVDETGAHARPVRKSIPVTPLS